MKKLLSSPTYSGIISWVLFSAIRATPALAADASAVVSPAALDPTSVILQGGGFGLCVYLVIWLTTKLDKTVGANMEVVTAALNANTAALQQLKDKFDK